MAEKNEAILKLLATYKQSVFAKDAATFTQLYDEGITVFDMWMKWKHQGIQSWAQMVQEWFGSLGTERIVVDFSEVEIHESPAMSFVSAFVKYTAISDNGATLRFQSNRLTWVLQLKNNSWKVIHEHTSAPADHSTMKVILQPN